MKHLTVALVAPLLLSACMPAAPVDITTADQCGAAGLQNLVGQPQGAIAAMTFPEGTRIITPGMAVTMDYRPDRLNITIGDDGNIASVTCT